jgi:hypothetical protein
MKSLGNSIISVDAPHSPDSRLPTMLRFACKFIKPLSILLRGYYAMKRWGIVFLVGASTILFVFVFGNIWRYLDVLSFADITMWIDDHRSPAISFPETNQKNYNKWLCFDADSASVSDVEIEYNRKKIVPVFDVYESGDVYQFNIDPEENWNSIAVKRKWNDLLSKQKTICFFAAYLQTDPDCTLAWYITKIKTKNGYWERSDNRDIIR